MQTYTSPFASLALRCAAALIAAAACSCTAQQPPADSAASAPFDPLAGDYPHILWHCNIWQVPAQCYLTHDGLLRANGGPQSNGMYIATAEQWHTTTESIRSLPGARHLASPAIFAKPGALARISQHDKDKAGASSGEHSIAVMGTLDGKSISTALEVVNHRSGEQVSCGSGPQAVPKGGCLCLLCPGPEPTLPWTLVSVHPVVLRSVADYPFQRASALIEEEPALAK